MGGRRGKVAFVLVLLAFGCAVILLRHKALPRSSGPLASEAYVWQRAWTPAVQETIGRRHPHFRHLIVLAAEVTFERGTPRLARAGVDYASLQAQNVPVGLALRVGPWSGDPRDRAEAGEYLARLTESLVRDARAAGISVCELQVDFDCAASKLGDYRQWLTTIRSRVAPVPLTFTALPSWLGRSDFVDLARSCDGFVLQVHSLHRPGSIDEPLTLCDAPAAQQACEKAARFGVPFRVALPTYGYMMAFDARGKFLGLSAEGPAPAWPDDARLRTVFADPAAMAQLVQNWSADRPANMTGVIWYRLPAATDAMNWRWETLESVMAGRAPSPHLAVEARRNGDNLVEIELRNEGTGDSLLGLGVRVHTPEAQIVGADSLGGFEQTFREDAERGSSLVFSAGREIAGLRLPPGERRSIGWIRLSRDTEVKVHVVPLHP